MSKKYLLSEKAYRSLRSVAQIVRSEYGYSPERRKYHDPFPWQLMFEVRGGEKATSLSVRAGVCQSYDGSVHTNVDTETDDSVMSQDPKDKKTLEGIVTTQYVIAALDDPDIPTKVEILATGSASWPIPNTSAGGKEQVRVLAKVECSGGYITRITKIHTGPWIRSVSDSTPLVDDLSINLTTAIGNEGEIQDYGWEDPTSYAITSLADLDRFMVRQDSDGAKRYITFEDLMVEIESEITIYDTFLALTDTPASYPTTPYEDQIWIPKVNDDGNALEWGNLIDIGLGYYWELGGDEDTCYGNAVGNGTSKVMDLTSRLLIDTAQNTSVDWENRTLSIHTLIPVADVAVLDWANQELNEPWAAKDTTNATDAGTGAFTVAGGLGVAYDIWSGATVHADTGFAIDADNYWSASAAQIKTSGNIVLASAGNITLADDTGGARIYVQNDLIELNPSGGGSTKINEKTVDWKRAADLDPDDYVLVGA